MTKRRWKGVKVRYLTELGLRTESWISEPLPLSQYSEYSRGSATPSELHLTKETSSRSIAPSCRFVLDHSFSRLFSDWLRELPPSPEPVCSSSIILGVMRSWHNRRSLRSRWPSHLISNVYMKSVPYSVPKTLIPIDI